MKLPFPMLLDFVQTSLTADQVGDLLTMAGFELEGIEDVEGDPVLDIKVMANRGDGLSALGLSREILAKDASAKPTELYLKAVKGFEQGDESAPDAGQKAKVSIETDQCTRYACRVFEGVENGDSPEWLQKRLRQAGQRPISLLVDLTNYVMLQVGQPLHAFDFDTLGGGQIIVRQARAGEKLQTLNGQDNDLQPHHMMICDATTPVAVAGVMGGAPTEVSEGTKTMLLESAHFVNQSVRKTRKQLGISTEASYRFERHVDPNFVVAALNLFLEHYRQITGKASLPGVVDVFPTPPIPVHVNVRMSRAELLLGMKIEAAEGRRYLEGLGFGVSGDGEPFAVQAPSWRIDIQLEDDVIEDLARVHGYENIPETLPKATMVRGGVFDLPALADHARVALLRCGLNQVMNHTLRGAHPLDFSDEWRLGPRNPHSPEINLLRDSLLPGLAETAVRNGARNLHLFEIGRVFLKGEYQIDESPEICILSTGELESPHWQGGEGPKADFFSLKGMVEELAAALGDHITFDYPRDPDRRFHPTRQSGVLLDQNRSWAGTIGQIHPDLADELGLPRETYMAELDLLVFMIHDNAEPQLKPISRNPAIRRDIAFLISSAVPWQEIQAAVTAAGGAELENHWLFDIYAGKGVPEGQHSLAVALQFRRMGENLNDEQANALRDQILEAVKSLGGVLR